MKKYVVAYIDWFDNELKMSFVETENELQALYFCAAINGMLMKSNISSVEDFQQECIDCDCMMTAKEIPYEN